MARTRHIEKRMNERAIKASMLDAVEMFGEWDGDKLILNKKGAGAAIHVLDRLRKDLIDVERKGGVVLVQEGEVDITTYALNSYRRGRKH